jgi:hypothetical protein
MPFQNRWRNAYPESHNSRMQPTLPTLPLPLDTDGLEIAREQALDYIEFVARNYAPDAAEIEIRLAASRLN